MQSTQFTRQQPRRTHRKEDPHKPSQSLQTASDSLKFSVFSNTQQLAWRNSLIRSKTCSLETDSKRHKNGFNYNLLRGISLRVKFSIKCSYMSMSTSNLVNSSRRAQRRQPSTDADEDKTLPMASVKARSKPEFKRLLFIVYLIKYFSKAWNQRFPGWRGGVVLFSILAAVILLVNLSALIYAATHLEEKPFATIAMGTYQNMSQLTTYLQCGITLLSTALLAGSNYCMQCLTSPTREEIDTAHARGEYLDIGVMSWRNVARCRKRRKWLLTVLGLSSVALHALYV